MEERRRSERRVMEAQWPTGLLQSVPVQVLDISVAGVLLQSSRVVDVGSEGALRLTVEGQVIAADLAVTRVLPVEVGPNRRFQIGARFVTITPEHRQAIERLTQ
jgi:hypothetical protein